MAKNTEESAAECSLRCKIEDNDDYFLEGKLAGQALDLAQFSFLLLPLPRSVPAGLFSWGCSFRDCAKRGCPKASFIAMEFRI